MSGNKIALRYAKALFKVANANNILTDVMDNMILLKSTMDEQKDLVQALKNPVVKASQKEQILLQSFKSFNPTVLDFMSLIVNKNRAEYMGEITAQFMELFNEQNLIVTAEVSSATALTDKEEREVIALLEKRTGAKQINLTKNIKSDLIGGLVIQYGDSLLDSSVLSRINTLKKELQIA